MDSSKKLDVSSKDTTTSSSQLIPNATYKPIPEDEMEEKPLTRPKSLAKSSSNVSEGDRADEKMLPDEDRKLGSNSKINVAEVTFTKNDRQNGDAKLDIGEVKSGYVGLGKEELLRYANDPFWVRLRWFLFIAFWLLWAAMLVGAVMIIVAAPKCVPPPPKTWWESGPLVEVDFASATADQLSVLAGLGATGVIASLDEVAPDPFSADPPLEQSPALLELAARAAAAHLRLIVDVAPLHSTHWFAQSERRDLAFEDYYVWADGRGFNASGSPNAPNNWLNEDDSPAWRYSSARRQFYLASPAGLPQLNYRSAPIQAAARRLLQQLARVGGAAVGGGVRVRGLPRLLVDTSLADEEPTGGATDYAINEYGFYRHRRTENLPEVAEVLVRLRSGVPVAGAGNDTEAAAQDGGAEESAESSHDHVFMIREQVTSLEPYQLNGTLLIDLPQQSKALQSERLAKSGSVASQLRADLTGSLQMFEGHWPAWRIQHTNYPADVINIVTFLLPGVPILNASDVWDKTLLTIRTSPSIMYGSYNFYEVANKTTFAYIRVHSGNPGFLVAFNPTQDRVVINFTEEIPLVVDEITVQLVSSNYNETGIDINLKTSAKEFPLSPESSVILSYVPKSQ